MDSVLDEMRAVLEGGPDALMHYGTKRHSGRYPFGSGEDPFQHEEDFLTRIERLRKDGWVENAENVQKEFGMKLEDYRNEKYWSEYTRKLEKIEKTKSLKEKGLGNSAIAREIGETESTVRGWFDAKAMANFQASRKIAEFLQERIDSTGHGLDVGKDSEKWIDISDGVEKSLGVSRTKLDQAIYALEAEGYVKLQNRIPQPNNPGKTTTQMILCPPGTPKDALFKNKIDIDILADYKYQEGIDGFKKKFTYPESLDSKRLMIRYADDVGPDGFKGVEKDGVIEIRRGCEDLDLKGARYSQVRIMVDGTHYLKGMAVYSDNMPDGVDVIFNTNKKKGTPALGDKDSGTVLKPIKKDPENPFGTTIKDADDGGQYWYKDKKTGEEKLGLINKKSSEGDWSEWKDGLPSQFLAKQSKELAMKQLNLAKEDRYREFESIMAIDNPTIKKHFLNSFAEDCDGAAVNLKAAALPGQKYHVIIPINNQKDTEIYAPSYPDGTKLALVRYPHAGIFEIPVVTVNNKNKLARQMLGTDSTDAVGITSKVAAQLSGADFDGDTVMCIPTDYGKTKIERSGQLKGLVGFEPKDEYGTTYKDGSYYNCYGDKIKLMTKQDTQREMGVVSNLITDMTLAGAGEDELARAVRHSMVVIDAEKHHLDYKRSEIENNIAQLKRDYQVTVKEDGTLKTGGASTIISRAKGVEYVTKRRGQARIDPETGKATYLDAMPDDLYYVKRDYDKKTGMVSLRTAEGKKITYNTNNPEEREKYAPIGRYDKEKGVKVFTNKAGDITYKTETRTQKVTAMSNTDDAYTLVSAGRHQMELIYADYANSMKALANQARKEMVTTGTLVYNPSAAKTYKPEVDALMARLNEAEKNTVLERQAQRLTNRTVKEKIAAAEESGNPMEKGDIRKANQQAITRYRQEVGSVSRRDRNIKITDREWEAIQAGAIHESKLKRILANADADELRQRATPREYREVPASTVARLRTLNSTGKYTIAQIADQLGLSASTVKKYLKGVD